MPCGLCFIAFRVRSVGLQQLSRKSRQGNKDAHVSIKRAEHECKGNNAPKEKEVSNRVNGEAP